MLNTSVYIDDDEVEMPAADSDFIFGGATVSDGWEFTRDGAALGRGPDGRWVSYAANVPRPYHHGTGSNAFSPAFNNAFLGIGNYLYGTLIEPSRAQLVLTSRPLVATFVEATATVDTTTPTPFGLGGRSLVANTTSNAHGWTLFFGGAARASAVPDGAEISGMFTFKPLGNMKRGIIQGVTKTNTTKSVQFTVENGGSILTNGMTWARMGVDTDGHFTIEFAFNVGTGTVSAGGCHFYLQNDAPSRFFPGDGTLGVLVAYFGLEVGNETTSPILTSGTAVVRAEDVLQSSASWMTQGQKSFGIQYTPMAYGPQIILNAGGTDSIELRTDQATVSYSATNGATNIVSVTGSCPVPTIERTTVITAGIDEFWLAQDGKKLAIDQSGNPPSNFDRIRLGARTTGAFFGPAIIKRVKYWQQALDRETAAAFSANLDIPGVVPVRPVFDIQPSRTVAASVTSLVLTVALTGEPTGASVSYRTVDGTATAGVDYTNTSGRLLLNAGQSDGEIVIPLLTRSLEQERTFRVELFNTTGATIGTAACVVTLSKGTPAAHAPAKYVRFNTALTADWSLVRSTPGHARNSSGTWVQVTAGQPRIHYSAADDAGLLLEPGSEQRLFESVTGWTTSNATVTTDLVTAVPTGTRSVKFRENSVNISHKLGVSWTLTNPDWPTGDVTVWMLVKPVGTRVYYRFSVRGIDNVWTVARFDFSANSGAGGITAISGAIVAFIEPEPMWPGWYRIGLSRGQTTSAGVAPDFDLYPVTAANSFTIQGDVNNGLDIAHFQVEPLAFRTSPIPVTGQSAKTVRAADVLKAAGGWQNRNSFALGAKFKRLNTDPASQRIVQFRDAVPSVDDFGFLTVSGTIQAPLTTGTTYQGAINGATNAVGSYMTALASIDTTRYALFADGVKSGEIAMVGRTMPELVEHLRFGSKEQDGSQAAPIILHSAAYWTVGLSDEEGNVFSADLTGTPPGGTGPDPLPTVSIPATMTVREGSIVEIPITKLGNGACSLSFNTNRQTATWNQDYQFVGPITVSFAENESTKLVTVTTLADADTLNEPLPGETFGISIFNPVGCGLGNAIGTVTILEKPRLSVPTNISVNEGGIASVIVTKAGIGACSFSWRTSAVTATTPADYAGQNLTVVAFGENETQKTLSVQTVSGDAPEEPQTFEVIIQSPVDCTITTSTCTVKIIDPSAPEEPEQGAFAAAVGFASAADCGLGQPIYKVTNLNDSGTGSLRAGVEAGNKMIVFEVAGRIQLLNHVYVESNITIAGETAPAPGITIQKREFRIRGNNVRISHICFQKGYAADQRDNSDCLKIGQGGGLPSGGTTQNVHFQHCAFMWSMDENVEHWPSAARNLLNISYHDCMFVEPLHKPSDYDSSLLNHEKMYTNGKPNGSNHTYGVIVGYNTKRIDFQYCLFSDLTWRAPFIDHSTQVVVANVIANNTGNGATIQQQEHPTLRWPNPLPDNSNWQATIKGYLCISGPFSGTASKLTGLRWNFYVTKQPVGTKCFASNLYGWKGSTVTPVPKTEVIFDRPDGANEDPYYLNGTTKVRCMVSAPPIDTPEPTVALSAQEIYDRLCLNAGPRPKEMRQPASVPKNPHILRKLNHLRDKTGQYVNHEEEVGGFYAPTQVARTLDANTTFGDGTKPGAIPTATDKVAMKAWLRKFLNQVQYD